ncbi:ArdC family protein [Neolewinella agarilytica]|uniref:Antirestriction protein ArdC n=1 Tax=Neolewinella agarilytica TaxID=478744 RepID=A0A1H9HEM8_9BACT|nr:zincin-like metallopeptidase domain-containing protein [Neolewinella agarilytica]SEQ60843.1 Antirestriction protein ArdC [Neolewinella agarilytica]
MQRTTRVKPDLYQVITDKVIALLEAGTVPWQRPWNQYGLARNYATGHVYTGINAFLLNFFPNFDVPFYLTYKQAQALGGQVRKGAKSETVYFFKTLYKDDDGKNLNPTQVAQLQKNDKSVKAIPMPRTFHLFNVADVDGIDFAIPELKENPSAPIEVCDDFVDSLQAVPNVHHKDLNRAFYAPKADEINMPPLPRFSSPEAYYKTLFHEIIHSTGHASRLSRPGITLPMEQRTPGSEPHAFEELIAELGAVYLCQHAGISRQPLQENAAAYIDSYLNLLKNDKRFLFQASSQAQKALNFLLEAPM